MSYSLYSFTTFAEMSNRNQTVNAL